MLASRTYSNQTVYPLIIAIWYKFVSTTWAYLDPMTFGPPNSHDLNPLYYICSVVRRDTEQVQAPQYCISAESVSSNIHEIARGGAENSMPALPHQVGGRYPQ
jgi:hypothetical protein